MTPGEPLVTVSLVTWNGMRWLPGCLRSLLDQDLPGWPGGLELLVIDNGSADGTLDWLRRTLPPAALAALIAEPRNTGYAPAHDRNLARATAPYVLLLNQDVELDTAFLRHAIAAFETRPQVAAVQARVRRLAGPGDRRSVIDTTGLVQHRDRRVVSRDQGRPDEPALDIAGEVWGVDGPVPVFRRAALEGARLPARGGGTEILDREFFAFKEDVDLAWRLRRLGWTAWYAPAVIAWHARGDSTTAVGDRAALRRARAAVPAAVKARSWRNQRLTQVKNDPLRAMLPDLWPIVRREIGSLGFALLHDRAVLRGIPPMISGLPWALRKRRALGRRVHARAAPVPADD